MQIVGEMIPSHVSVGLQHEREKQGACNSLEKSYKIDMAAGEEMVKIRDFGCNKE